MNVQEHVPLAPYTTLKVGGPARYVIHVASKEALEQARQFATQTALPVLVLGHGSNVLVSDKGFRGVVIVNQIQGTSYSEPINNKVTATFGAGEDWDVCVADSVSRGLWGLENLSHIPGTVGATPIQNVGAYKVEVSDLIVSVEAMSLTTGKTKNFSNSDCQFTYRDSYFKSTPGRDWVITQVSFELSTSSDGAVLEYADLKQFAETHATYTAQELRNEIIAIRSQKFPDWQTVGTAGSFFKNPTVTRGQQTELVSQYPEMPHFKQPDGTYKVSLGWILDKVCNLRGYCERNVCLSEHQALVLLNYGTTAQAIIGFATFIQTEVEQKTKIKIEPEVRFV